MPDQTTPPPPRLHEAVFAMGAPVPMVFTTLVTGPWPDVVDPLPVAKDWIDAQHGTNADWFRERRIADLERELAGAEAKAGKAYAKIVRDELAETDPAHDGEAP